MLNKKKVDLRDEKLFLVSGHGGYLEVFRKKSDFARKEKVERQVKRPAEQADPTKSRFLKSLV